MERERTAGELLQSSLLAGLDGVVHGFGVRGVTVPAYLDALGVADRYLFETNQVHDSRVHYLMWPKKGPPLAGDAFITDRPGIVCSVRTADCVPILVADPERRAVAAIHAGWKGTAEDVVGATMRAMRDVFGTDPASCVAAIGPCIAGAHYEVGKEVIDALGALGIDGAWRVDGTHVDLARANALLLARAGLPSDAVDALAIDTSSDERFASWRRDHTDVRQVSFILIV